MGNNIRQSSITLMINCLKRQYLKNAEKSVAWLYFTYPNMEKKRSFAE